MCTAFHFKYRFDRFDFRSSSITPPHHVMCTMHTLYNHPENHKESRSPSPSFSTRATMVCLGVTIVNQVLLPVDRPEVGSRLEIGHCTFECPIYIFQITLDIQNQNYHKRTWRTSEVRGKGSSGPVFGLNAMCQAALGQLNPQRDNGLAYGRPGQWNYAKRVWSTL